MEDDKIRNFSFREEFDAKGQNQAALPRAGLVLVKIALFGQPRREIREPASVCFAVKRRDFDDNSTFSISVIAGFLLLHPSYR